MERWAASEANSAWRQSSTPTSLPSAGSARAINRPKLSAAVNLRIKNHSWQVASESLAQRELEELGIVTAFVVKWLGNTEGQRPYRSQPGESHTDAVTQVPEINPRGAA